MSDFSFILIILLTVAGGFSAVVFYIKKITAQAKENQPVGDTSLSLIKQD